MRIAYKTFIISLAQLSASMERILIFMILSRTLNIFDYGTYQQVWLYYLLVLPLFMLGLPSSLLYLIPKADNNKRKTIVFQTFFLLELVGLVFSAVTFLMAPQMAIHFGNPSLALYMRIFAFYPLFSLPPRLINLLMVANDQPVISAVISFLYSITIVLFVTLPSIFGLPLIYTFYGALVGGGIFFVGAVVYLLHYYRTEKFYWDWGLLREQIIYALPLGLSSIVATLAVQINRLVVSTSFPPEMFAIFTNGAFEIPFIGMITGSLMIVLIPEFVSRLKNNKDIAEVWTLWNSATLRTAIFLFPIAVSLFVFAEDFIVIMFTDKYLLSVGIFRIYLLLAIFRITHYSSLLQAMGRTKLIFITSLVGLFINLILSIVSIPLLGLSGPAWANVITSYSWGVILLLMITRLYNTNFSQILPWKKLGFLLLLAITAGVFSIPLLQLPLIPLVRLSIGMGVYLGLYLGLLMVFKMIDLGLLLKYLTEVNQIWLKTISKS
jgi:O-antigen/teichoic acid export membrane protein